MLLISDLDGTLLPKGGSVSVKDKDTLAQARLEGNLCVIATGRSLYGVETELEPDFPIDYLIFSSGAGIFDWKNKELIHHNSLSTEQVQTVFHQINEHEVDFTIQLSAPHSHRFYFSPRNPSNVDFHNRIEFHKDHGEPLNPQELPKSASEFIIIQSHPTTPQLFETLRNSLSPQFNVVRATSPFDGKSLWVEILHAQSSKATASEWLRNKHRIPIEKTFALGNDYNDLQLLAWAGKSWVVGDAVPELLATYPKVAPHHQSSFTEAYQCWSQELKR